MMDDESPIARWCDALAGSFERRNKTILLLLLTAVGLIYFVRAVQRPFWYDEICTVVVSRLPGYTESSDALKAAVDTNPPPYYSLTRFAHRFIQDEHVAYRLPSILAFLGTIACLWAVLVRRVSALASFVGVVSILLTALAKNYVAEARPYALMVGLLSLALAAWQRVDDSKFYLLVLAVALAGSLSFHYYAILAFPVFFLAEAAVAVFDRRLRFPVWMALAAGLSPMLIFSGHLASVRQYYGTNFWARPYLGQIFGSYDTLLNVENYWGWFVAAGIVAVFGYCLIARRRTVRDARDELPQQVVDIGAKVSMPAAECVFLLGMILLPVIAVVIAKAGRGGMTDRYMMPVIIGFALAIGYLTALLGDRLKLVMFFLFAATFALTLAHDTKAMLNGSLLAQRQRAASDIQAILASHRDAALPVVISSGLRYLPMAYYAPAEESPRLHAITDPEGALQFIGTDSIDLALLVLRRFAPLQVRDHRSFLATHQRFLLVASVGAGFDWWHERLLRDGYVLQLVSVSADIGIYEVTLRP